MFNVVVMLLVIFTIFAILAFTAAATFELSYNYFLDGPVSNRTRICMGLAFAVLDVLAFIIIVLSAIYVLPIVG